MTDNTPRPRVTFAGGSAGRRMAEAARAGVTAVPRPDEPRPRDDRPLLTIRKATDAERHRKFPPIVAFGRRVRVPKYVCVGASEDRIWTVFGMPLGGDTRAEAVFWAERTASKNDLRYAPPVGWENVEGKLP